MTIASEPGEQPRGGRPGAPEVAVDPRLEREPDRDGRQE
jgi:hypothetical protein